jgi:hypothetical protein
MQRDLDRLGNKPGDPGSDQDLIVKNGGEIHAALRI